MTRRSLWVAALACILMASCVTVRTEVKPCPAGAPNEAWPNPAFNSEKCQAVNPDCASVGHGPDVKTDQRKDQR